MTTRIWLMEGLSSQRDIIQGITAFSKSHQVDVEVFASHRHQRNEILSQADFALLEPADEQQRLNFILTTVNKYAIQAIHTGRNALWFETHRAAIEACGVRLATGATRPDLLELADDKVAFAQLMEKHGLPVVPSIRVNSAAELRQLIAASPFSEPLCIKPVTGIYGMGFWRFDDSVSPMATFTHPENRKVNAGLYLNALEESDSFEPLVLMPYLPGPEYSVDILAERGTVLAAVARRKEGALQYLENSGEAFELAKACAQVMGADGLVNVQTRNDSSGKPVLLEINMRPSGGIGYTRFSGVNLPGLFALRQLGLMEPQAIIDEASRVFSPATVRSVTDVINYSTALPNFIQ
ncbi:ATP-grasp domain-containing protein [Winslowiella iniecta]|uniref:Carbamoyl-phosphate synthase large chain n=1 Tax=Winslowiella iniecta TaxID=1560201 RepID=A0A0L7T5Y8_9GAMM|nr:ATP-grasp domain-containing protein [Winslowiella iniecta]KOC90807.1 carbamoyl-phosphate synthase large chain [Winslowiella iniecta]KOC94232.1 carbamoyl-phosphate synthase large chain [Winslowiella iniecta]